MAGSGDTIFAAATAPGSSITLLRLSGPNSRFALETMTGNLPEARRFSRRRLHDADGQLLDDAAAIWLPAPGSYTGEDSVELHLHGGRAVLAAVSARLLDLGLRPAAPGEFTRRAFINGRMDLTEAEGLADLLAAETDQQRRQALRQLEGELGSAVSRWRNELLDLLALSEAQLDFADEEDLGGDVFSGAILTRAAAVEEDIAKAISGAGNGERVREGWIVAILGPPNAGKSSLLNALARRDVAIVTAVAGTTRDLIEVRCDIGGWPVTFIDTAGLRQTDDEVERIGVARAEAAAARADLVLWLSPADAPSACPLSVAAPLAMIGTKIDLGPAPKNATLGLSTRTGQGLDTLTGWVQSRIESGMERSSGLVTRQRHRRLLMQCRDALAVARQPELAPELASEQLRLAVRSFDELVGRAKVDDVLDRIFGQFCIGK